MTGHKDAFEGAACDVLAAMYFDTNKIAQAEYQHGLKPVLFPTSELGLLFQTLCELSRAGQPINDNTILSRIGSKVDTAWLTDVLHVYTPDVGKAFDINCMLVKDYGTRASGSRIGKILSSQFDNLEGKETDVIVSQGIDVLSALTTHAVVQETKSDQIAEGFTGLMGTPSLAGIKSGIPWLDGLTGGFNKGDVWWTAGAYKMRKTTLMLNMILHAAMSGASIALMSREMRKMEVAAQLVSMLAVADLMTTGEYESKNASGQYLNWISGRGLLMARNQYRSWNKRKVEAIDRGMAAFKGLGDRLRIYDTSQDGGGLSDIDSALLMIKRDQYLYNADVVFVDYLQLFDAPGNGLFDKVSYSARAFQEIAKRDNIAVMIAAQRNEEAVKNGHGDYSPGIKGGGDPAATADFLLQTRYKYNDSSDENTLEITLKLSRHGSGGDDTKYLAPIHPNSGLLLDSELAAKSRHKFDVQFGKKNHEYST